MGVRGALLSCPCSCTPIQAYTGLSRGAPCSGAEGRWGGGSQAHEDRQRPWGTLLLGMSPLLARIGAQQVGPPGDPMPPPQPLTYTRGHFRIGHEGWRDRTPCLGDPLLVLSRAGPGLP